MSACPAIVSDLINFNCDKYYKVTFIGDSIVSGAGDTRNGNWGGYVKRLAKRMPKAKVTEDGVPGVTTSRLIRMLKSEFRKRRSSRFFRKAYGADLVIVDVGRNDYWNEGASASGSARNVKRIVNIARKKLRKNGVAPYVVAATMLPTNRGFQQPFVDGINRTLRAMVTNRFRVDLAFDSMPNSLLSSDGLHPTSAGYSWLTDLIENYIYGKLQSKMGRERPDSDSDGVYDIFERKKFKTDPDSPDTDGDGITDGEELFQLNTDPLDPLDPQQEGIPEFEQEVDFAVPSPTPTPLPVDDFELLPSA